MSKTTFNISQYLDIKEMIAECQSQVLKDGNIDELIEAVDFISKAKGMNNSNAPSTEIQ